MILLDRVLPGEVWDASPLARILPAGAPDPVLAQLAGILVVEGFAFVPVPGPRGLPGPAANGTDLVRVFLPVTALVLEGAPLLALASVPAQPPTLHVNGLKQRPEDILLTGSTLSFLGHPLYPGDAVEVLYLPGAP